ncbi:hypothetical protein [Natrialba taiwanensis]|uniref:hypothetical protein n=1 Tax=Natrialba taiwanensis TaxID=160846 RepID=UPI000B1D77A9|nr:hypothetical protein [Natrialba taiwanensis]
MGLRESLAALGAVLEGDEITGRQAAIIVAVWMGGIAVFGIVAYLIVFVIIGF